MFSYPSSLHQAVQIQRMQGVLKALLTIMHAIEMSRTFSSMISKNKKDP